MYAVVRTGGKQYRVNAGESIRVEKLAGGIGDAIALAEVLLVADGDSVRIGQPLVTGAVVKAEIVEQGRGRKLTVYKYRRRKRYHRKKGHRQAFTRLKITGIQA